MSSCDCERCEYRRRQYEPKTQGLLAQAAARAWLAAYIRSQEGK